MGNRCANHVTPLYPQKLALTSPTGGGRSVGMVRSRTTATEFIYISHPALRECASVSYCNFIVKNLALSIIIGPIMGIPSAFCCKPLIQHFVPSSSLQSNSKIASWHGWPAPYLLCLQSWEQILNKLTMNTCWQGQEVFLSSKLLR